MSARLSRKTGREVVGFPLGSRQGRGSVDGWNPVRESTTDPQDVFPPRGTVRTNLDSQVNDDADGW